MTVRRPDVLRSNRFEEGPSYLGRFRTRKAKRLTTMFHRLVSLRVNLGTKARSFTIALLVICLAVQSASRAWAQESQIETLAHRHFPKMQLTECERNLLAHVSTGEVAYCGASHSESDKVPGDPGNKRMQYDVDAELIRWICVDPSAVKLVDPKGIQIHAARIVHPLDLSFATVPFPLTFENSRFVEDINLSYNQLLNFDLTGSQTRAIVASNTKVRGDLVLGGGFSAEGEVNLIEADIGGDLNGAGGTFKNPGKYALDAGGLRAANVDLRNGFSAEGEVNLLLANLGGNLDCEGGKFKNPGQYALDADSLKADNVDLRNGFSAEGEVNFILANLSGNLDCEGGTFKNPGKNALNADSLKAASVFLSNGFGAEGEVNLAVANAKGGLVWMNLGAGHADKVVLDLSHATFGPLFDDEESWPQQGNLILDGFVYSRIGGGPKDARSRLRWLGRLRPKDTQSFDFTPQPYEQLAKVLREDGDDAGARDVLIAMENARWWYGKIGFWERCWSRILWLTIGYGYDTWRALWFIGGFVLAGTFLFFWGYRSEAITQVDKEKPEHFRPFNSFVYSLETFLPLVDLHQAKHWAPDPEIRQLRPPAPVAAFKPLSKYQHQFGPAFGRRLRWYLWIHILAGWFFTSMLIAGITGLVQKG